MHITARLLPVEKKTPTCRTLFPKLSNEALHTPDKLECILAKRLPVNCTDLYLQPNGPIELLLTVIKFCHLHEISLTVQLPEDTEHPREEPEDKYREVLTFFNCTGCGARYSSAFHSRCPHCGGWGYAPHYEMDDAFYKSRILDEDLSKLPGVTVNDISC